MATFTTEHMNLEEAYRRENYENFELLLGPLVENNDFLRVAAVLPSNNGANHKTLVATELGEGAFRNAYGGIKQMNSKTKLVSEPIVSYEGESVVDTLILDGSPDPVKARLAEDGMNLQGFANGFNKELVYAKPSIDTSNFAGLANRRAKIGTYCYDCGGTAANALSSLYLMEFGEMALALRYMQGTTPGITNMDKGENRVPAADNSGYYWAFINYFKINFGLTLRQESALQRFANIDPTADLTSTLFKNIIKAKNKLPSKGKRAYLFCNSDVHSLIDILVLDKASNTLTIQNIENYGPVVMFMGIPILNMDALKSTEAKVS